ncbi:MAG: M48 family metalloprotease, partial [Phormidesmis sp. RL_2_1]|nr:M48 family metalloprotease [Phormidesmis sp. RL_2_1]
MKFSPKFLSLLTLLAVPLISTATLPSAVTAKPLSVLEQAANKNDDAFYQNARSALEGSLGQLGQDYYVVYRIVERIARANGLDESPWRVRVTDDLNINAYASEVNMLTFEAGILEQLDGDTAALACVVGHEMAHHTENHIPDMVAARVRIEGLQEEALVQARGEVESAQQQGSILGSVLGAVTGGIFNSIGVRSSVGGILAGNVVNSALQGLNADQTQQATARAEELYKERVAALDAEYSAQMRSQEAEADEVGYQYMVRAGFSPDGCIRVMNVLNRIETSRLPSL